MEKLHLANLILHVVAGSIALLTGFVAVFVQKGLGKHVLFGKYFMWMILVVTVTGLLGIIIFNRNNFLLIITLLSGYNCYSGIRALRLRGQKPDLPDYIIPILVMVSALYYLYYVNSTGLYWSPVITYSTIAALFVITGYDLCKYFISGLFLKKAMMYEHAYKMVGALSAILSAFSGTVFPDYKPYSQFIPSVAGVIYIIITFIFLSKRSLIFKTKSSVRHSD